VNRYRLVAAVVAAITVVQWSTGYLVRQTLAVGGTVRLLDRVIYIQHLESPRHLLLISFSVSDLGSRYDLLLQLALVLMMLWVYSVTPGSVWWLRWGLSFVIGGIVASAGEVVVRQSVTDYLGLGTFAVTNAVDASLLAGGLLCGYLSILAVVAPHKLPWKIFKGPERE
jgi:lipoprotein signal peptidase